MDKEYDFLIDDKETYTSMEHQLKAYKVLIVDDEVDVHKATKLALSGLSFEGIPVHFISSYTAEDAKRTLIEHGEVAIILLDVVMEYDHAGLDFVDFVRKELKNDKVRIILRTGQPGVAIEEKVIVDYDINDYKDKTELTRKKLFTTVYSTLRAYRDINKLYHTQKGLRQIIENTGDLFNMGDFTFQEFVVNILEKLMYIRGYNQVIEQHFDSFFIYFYKGHKKIIAAKGKYESLVNVEDERVDALIESLNLNPIIESEQNVQADITDNNELIFMHKSVLERKSLYYQVINQDNMDMDISRLYMVNFILGIDNYFIKKDMFDSQVESMYVLSETIEQRSQKTANHVKRVAALTELFSIRLGLSDYEVSNYKLASMLHDIGKIGIPDAILLKPDKLTFDEYEVVKTHTTIGYKILIQSNLPLMVIAADIAYCHHEHYDGKGYPRGLKGDEIPLAARVVAIVDVFDALVTRRVYKEPWPFEEALAYIKTKSGNQFDPQLVALFEELKEQMLHIYKIYPWNETELK